MKSIQQIKIDTLLKQDQFDLYINPLKFGLVMFYGISTLVGYLMSNPVI